MPDAIPVTPDNFARAETDMYFANMVRNGGLGKFTHNRELTPLDQQTVIRMNRDTLYSSAVFDLEAGPVTVTFPDSGARFMSMMVIDEDEYALEVQYKPGRYRYSRDTVATRYFSIFVRTFIDPRDPADLLKVHALQDAVTVDQKSPGRFETPPWDAASQKDVREALAVLGRHLRDSKHFFGTRGQVDPLRHLIGAAGGWGGNPEKDASYVSVTLSRNDAKTVYRLRVKDVPVDGFWSVSVYNKAGFFEMNRADAYSFNTLTAQPDADGGVTIQFGGDPQGCANHLPVTPGWNYTVRLYRPRPEILSGQWKFPEAQPVN